MHTSSRVFVSHSAPDNADSEPFDSSIFRRALEMDDLTPPGAAFRLLWGRDYRQANADVFARLVDADILLHGHEPCPAGFQVPNNTQIILDSSNSYGTCVMIPVGRKLTQQEVVRRIQRLGPEHG